MDIIFLFFANLICFSLFAIDKYCAQNNYSRIPEFILLLFTFLGGAFGALCGMILYRHKSSNRKFRIIVPLLLYIELGVAVLYRMQIFYI